MITKCIQCGIGFKHSPSHKRKYCSRVCMGKAYMMGRNSYIECAWCKKLIKQNRVRVKKYCSKLCRKESIEYNAKQKHIKYCKFCLRKYIENPQSHKNRKYCSVICANRAKFYESDYKFSDLTI